MKTGSMVIDAQAIEHLELLEIPNRSRFTKEGSFFNFMASGCSTAFGKRLLKRWVCGPLKDANKVNERLDAVTDLVINEMIRDKLRAKL
jgi:DNA mismatch repair protein MSH6